MSDLYQLVKDLPWDDILEAYQAAIDAGKKPREASRVISKVIDESIDLHSIVPGPAGEVLEIADRALIRIAVGTLLAAARHRKAPPKATKPKDPPVLPDPPKPKDPQVLEIITHDLNGTR